jgi:hypothetical protein
MLFMGDKGDKGQMSIMMSDVRGLINSFHITHRRSLLVTSVGDQQGADNRRLFRWR